MINPFDLPGREFLVFYTCLGLIVLAALHYLQRQREQGPLPRLDTSDPYLIAYLRGGKEEAARVATVSLIDRGILARHGTTQLIAKAEAEIVHRPIEKGIVGLYARPLAADLAFHTSSVEAACKDYATKLTQLGLLPDASVQSRRTALLWFALAILLGIATIKTMVALGRGQTNILFLVFMAAGFSVLAYKVATGFRTIRGNRILADLRRLFARLKARSSAVRSGGATAEVALLAAVFGLGALPSSRYAYVQKLYPKWSKKWDSSCGSSCGLSWGSTCGGGGCDGGGGGGGGGGCGGCGGG